MSLPLRDRRAERRNQVIYMELSLILVLVFAIAMFRWY